MKFLAFIFASAVMALSIAVVTDLSFKTGSPSLLAKKSEQQLKENAKRRTLAEKVSQR